MVWNFAFSVVWARMGGFMYEGYAIILFAHVGFSGSVESGMVVIVSEGVSPVGIA